MTHMSLPTPDMLSSFMASSPTAIAARLNSALVEAQLGRLVRDYVNVSHHVSAGSPDQYSWQLSQILKLLGTHNKPVWAQSSGPLSSISTDQFLQPDALRWLLQTSSQNQINQGFVSGQKDDSTKYNAFSQESSQFSDLEKKSEGKNLPISTDHGNEHTTASSFIEDQPLEFDTEITDWNSMPIIMPSSNPDNNDHLYYYSDKQSSSTTSTNSYKGRSEVLENTFHYHQDDPFGSAVRTSKTVSLPAARAEQREDESIYWFDLLNSIEDSNPDPNYMTLPLPSQ